jgi:hypothetical protein
MKIIISILVLLLIAIIYFRNFHKPNTGTVTIGKSDLIESMLDGLMKSTNEYGFLIISKQGSDDFIQFTGDKTGVQLAFPLVTERQKSQESDFRGSSAKLNLEVVENKGRDGSWFLDINIKGNSSEISDTVKKFLAFLFDVDSNTQLEFTYDL